MTQVDATETVERDIYECSNQLGGWVGPDTEEGLAQFLIRESEAACALADEIVKLRAALAAPVASPSREEVQITDATVERAMAAVEMPIRGKNGMRRALEAALRSLQSGEGE